MPKPFCLGKAVEIFVVVHLQVWLSLAEQHIKELKIDWEKTVKFAFNERSNPDDNKLGVQIVKVS